MTRLRGRRDHRIVGAELCVGPPRRMWAGTGTRPCNDRRRDPPYNYRPFRSRRRSTSVRSTSRRSHIDRPRHPRAPAFAPGVPHRRGRQAHARRSRQRCAPPTVTMRSGDRQRTRGSRWRGGVAMAGTGAPTLTMRRGHHHRTRRARSPTGQVTVTEHRSHDHQSGESRERSDRLSTL